MGLTKQDVFNLMMDFYMNSHKMTNPHVAGEYISNKLKKMNRQNIIVVIPPKTKIQTWGNFKKACEANGLPYHSLKMLKFPITHKGYKIEKVRFNEA